jgi:DNA-binding transcriptional LysR family regulator
MLFWHLSTRRTGVLHSRKLQYIDEIARCGSIRKAAARLNVASSAVNRQILTLEEEMGTPIFERLPRGLRLTAAGELYIEHIRDVLKNYERLESRIRGLKMPQAGKINLVTTIGLAAGPLPEIIARFIADHPRVRVHIRSDGGATTTANPVLIGEADLGLGLNIPATPGLRTLASFDIPLGVVLRPDHPMAVETSLSLINVVQEKLVLAQHGTSLRNVINLAIAPLPVSVEPVVETNSIEMLRQLVINGTGITLLNPLDVLRECRSGELVYIPLADPHIRLQPMKIFARARAPLDATTSLFVEYLTDEIEKLVQELQVKGYVRSSQEI